jgi:hypothetical protein
MIGPRWSTVVLATTIGLLSAGETDRRTKAVSEFKVSEPFVLDEQSIKRIAGVVKKRVGFQASTVAIHFFVTHADNTEYEIDNIDDVLNDPNPSSNPITRLRIVGLGPWPDVADEGLPPEERSRLLNRTFHQYWMDSQPKIEVEFGNDGSKGSIKGALRDWVLGSRIDVERELRAVSTSNYYLMKFRGPIALSAIVGVFFCSVCWARNRYDNRRRSITDPSSRPTSIADYIWKLHDPYWQPWRRKAGLLGVSAVSGMLAYWLYCLVVHHYFPGAVFAIGDQVKIYQDLMQTRTEIWWGVIVAFVVAVLAGGAVILVTSRRRAPETPIRSTD